MAIELRRAVVIDFEVDTDNCGWQHVSAGKTSYTANGRRVPGWLYRLLRKHLTRHASK